MVFFESTSLLHFVIISALMKSSLTYCLVFCNVYHYGTPKDRRKKDSVLVVLSTSLWLVKSTLFAQ